MASAITSLQRLQDSAQAIDRWIVDHKPEPSKSETIFAQFMERHGKGIAGDQVFIAKTTRIIEKASRTAAGITIMQRLLSTGRDITLHSDKQSGFFRPNLLTVSCCHPKHLNICINEEGERIAHRNSRVASFIHECMHAWHDFTDPSALEMRAVQLGDLSEMDSMEEELTITGYLHQSNPAQSDFCCENTALRELGYPLRINHRGINDRGCLSICQLVEHRLALDLQKLLDLDEISKAKEETALQVALCLHLLAPHPETRRELMNIIYLLLKAGCYSQLAFKIAILQNSEELMEDMLQKRVKLTDELLQDAIEEPPQRIEKLWKILEENNQILTISQFQQNLLNISSNTPELTCEARNQQIAILKARLSDARSLPIHSIKGILYGILYCNQSASANREFFSSWSKSHTYRPINLYTKIT